MRYCAIFLLLFIFCYVTVLEVHARKHLHNHDTDDTPEQIGHQEHKLGSSLTLRTEDSLTEKDAVKNIRKGGLLQLDADDR